MDLQNNENSQVTTVEQTENMEQPKSQTHMVTVQEIKANSGKAFDVLKFLQEKYGDFDIVENKETYQAITAVGHILGMLYQTQERLAAELKKAHAYKKQANNETIRLKEVNNTLVRMYEELAAEHKTLTGNDAPVLSDELKDSKLAFLFNSHANKALHRHNKTRNARPHQQHKPRFNGQGNRTRNYNNNGSNFNGNRPFQSHNQSFDRKNLFKMPDRNYHG